MPPTPPSSTKPTLLDWFFRLLGFTAMVAVAFTLPQFPALELDSSWRMAIGRFLFEGRQFGTDVVFTYGPLGFAMGKTYWGDHWGVLIGWHVVQAIVFSAVVYWHAYRLKGYSRVFFFLFFFLFGLSYQDAIHQTIIAFAGLALIRRCEQPWRWSSLALLIILTILSLVKFTNMLVAFFLVLLAGALELYKTRSWTAIRVPGIFAILFFFGWGACGQHPGNLPAYFHSSWEISQGYLDAMGLASNSTQLYLGLCTVGLVLIYLLVNFLTAGDRIRSLTLTLGALAYLYVNWKHGFIRADGHQIGFYYAALSIIVASPFLLEDAQRMRWLKRVLLVTAALVAVASLDIVLPGLVRGSLGSAESQVLNHVSFALGQSDTHADYDARFLAAANNVDLRKVKATVGKASVDVLGFEQAVAIFNHLNYQPRPVFQGYSAYTPYLSHLNYEYYASDRAPEYVLFKLQTLDGRLATMDDPHVLRLLVQRYTYLFSEQGFTLWQRKPGPFDAAAFAPKPIRTETRHFGETINLKDLADRNLWVEIDYHFSLLGKLRRFLFRPVIVDLHITDNKGVESVHRLPLPIGETGFMLNPLVDDMFDFMRAATDSKDQRRVASIRIDTAPQDRDCVQDELSLTYSALPPSNAGKSYFKQVNNAKFYMFTNAPISYEAHNPPNPDIIDKRAVMVMHAPSQMIFEVPAGTSIVQGDFGFVAGAYSNGGRTNGADFTVYWTDGSTRTVLFSRYLNPVAQLNDRGLQHFVARLPKSSGHVVMMVDPGPNGEFAFDWTGWTAIEFK